MSTMYCAFRKEHVAAQPEEVIRQKLLTTMTEHLGYPKSCFVIEKALSKLPHLAHCKGSLPERRVDILCYAPANVAQDFSLRPLLLVECKATALHSKALQQAAGYNYYIGAPFVSVTNGVETWFGWVDHKTHQLKFSNFLPYYRDLLLHFERPSLP